MYNELGSIGMLVFDLKRDKAPVGDGSNFAFLEEEFRRIIMDLGFQWQQKSAGWEYLLEFHRLETLRLFEAVVKLESFQIELAEISKQNDFLQELHTALMMHFAQLLSGIEKMLGASDLAAKPYHLN